MTNIRTAFAVILVGVVAGCSTSEPELPPPPPGSVVTSVSASSRDRDINGLPARAASTGLEDSAGVAGEPGSTGDECRNLSNSGTAPQECEQASVRPGG